MNLPRVRVHARSGVLLLMPGRSDWIWVAANGQVQDGRMTDAYADGPGGYELDMRVQLAVAPLAEATVHYLGTKRTRTSIELRDSLVAHTYLTGSPHA